MLRRKQEWLRLVSGDGVYDQWVWKGPATHNATRVYKPAGFGDGSSRLPTSFLSRCMLLTFTYLPKHILRKTSDEHCLCYSLHLSPGDLLMSLRLDDPELLAIRSMAVCSLQLFRIVLLKFPQLKSTRHVPILYYHRQCRPALENKSKVH